MTVLLRFIVGLLLLGVFLCLFPGGPWLSTYCSVDAEADMGTLEYPDPTFSVRQSRFSTGPDHIIRNGKLYLRIQSTRPSIVLVTTVDHVKWDPKLIAEYRSEHPQLESLWPDATKDNGGVLWLRHWPG